MAKTFFLLGICLLLCLKGFVQTVEVPEQGKIGKEAYTISGQITDTSGHAIKLARIETTILKAGTVTDEEGSFHLTITPGKKEKLVVSAVGYKTLKFRVWKRKKGKWFFNIPRHIRLVESKKPFDTTL
jgi:hypothetical protein